MVHTFPGMGADRRMYPDPWPRIPDLIVHDWPSNLRVSTIADLAKEACSRFAIADGDSVIGSSLGGMVACEVSKQRRLRHLILVGSAVEKDEVNGLLAFFRSLARYAPIEWLKKSAGSIPLETSKMFADSDPQFIREMCEAVFQWPGLGEPSCPLWRIHGKFDLVILLPRRIDLILNGGHLIAMTHAADCVASVLKFLSKQV